MKKQNNQVWVICNEKEQKELLSSIEGYKNEISSNNFDLPLVIDKEKKIVFRCTSISNIALQTKYYGKIKHYNFEQTIKLAKGQ